MTYQSNYDKYPKTKISGFDSQVWSGAPAIRAALRSALSGKAKAVLAVELCPGADKGEICRLLEGLSPALLVDADACALCGPELDAKMQDDLTEDRVFGILTTRTLDYYFLPEKLDAARQQVLGLEKGLAIVYGTGAALVCNQLCPPDQLVYCDMARWELQLRYRAGMSNWNTENGGAPIRTKYKRGFFIEWRLADRLKKQLLDRIDFLLDTNAKEAPVLITGEAFREGLRQVSQRPFRVKPYFDPGVWGGQWMKTVCGLDPKEKNYAWSFDGVPEENSLLLQYGDTVVELPAIDLVFYRPHQLLGERVHARFGTEFPIRFDFLDTMGEQNLSLQVHPLTEYIQDHFNMRYTQDESYYILDADPAGASVYLGLRTGINREDMLRDLRRAEKGEISFPAEQYVNKLPVKKHDHVLIPAGTVHCSGAGAMVLEISATPYIFTFKLWDCDRVDLDGLPLPIHLDHGAQNIQWDWDTQWVLENLVGQTQLLHEEQGVRLERTGLHTREFIETVRVEFSKPVELETHDSVNMLNLVEGREAVVTSVDGSFPPFPRALRRNLYHPRLCREVPYGTGSRPESHGDLRQRAPVTLPKSKKPWRAAKASSLKAKQGPFTPSSPEGQAAPDRAALGKQAAR